MSEILTNKKKICTKRGLLGACLETAVRTPENDNDKSAKYFRDPTELVKEKEAKMRASSNTEGSMLIEKLRQQTEDNREKNELLVKQKTAQNDQVRCSLDLVQHINTYMCEGFDVFFVTHATIFKSFFFLFRVPILVPLIVK